MADAVFDRCSSLESVSTLSNLVSPSSFTKTEERFRFPCGWDELIIWSMLAYFTVRMFSCEAWDMTVVCGAVTSTVAGALPA